MTDKKLTSFATLFFILSLAAPAWGQTAGVEAELRMIMELEFEAFRLRDPSAYSGLVADDAVFVGGGPEGFKTKADIVEEIKKAPPFFASASLAVTDARVRVYKDVAVLVCLATFKFKNEQGQDASLQFRMSRVHVRRDGAWRLVAHHGTGVR